MYRLQDLSNAPAALEMEIHLVIPFISARAECDFHEYDIHLHRHAIMPKFNVPNTFNGETATYFAHKIPVARSSMVKYIRQGCLVNTITASSRVNCIKDIHPPYKTPTIQREPTMLQGGFFDHKGGPQTVPLEITKTLII